MIPDEFREWLEAWFRLWEPADVDYPEMLADTLADDLSQSDWTVT